MTENAQIAKLNQPVNYKKPWSENEIALMLEEVKTLTLKEIAKKHERTTGEVHRKLLAQAKLLVASGQDMEKVAYNLRVQFSELNRNGNWIKRWSEEDDNFLMKNNLKYEMSGLKRMFRCSEDVICTRMLLLGFTLINSGSLSRTQLYNMIQVDKSTIDSYLNRMHSRRSNEQERKIYFAIRSEEPTQPEEPEEPEELPQYKLPSSQEFERKLIIIQRNLEFIRNLEFLPS